MPVPIGRQPWLLFVMLTALNPAYTARMAMAGDPEFRIAGYLPDYRMDAFDADQTDGLTDLIVFSAEPTETGILNLSRLAGAPWPELRRCKTEHRVRLLLAIGGWERSKHFAAVAASSELRATFVTDVVEHCLSLRLDGVDLDWEHPDGADQERSYGQLMSELRASFEPHGLMLSVTIAGWQQLPDDAIRAVDWVNVMAYDHDGRHSTYDNAVQEVQSLVSRGVPAGKITFGLPFYGRHVTERNTTRTWREIVATDKPADDVDEINGVYFNGPLTIRRKTRFARDTKLAGVMFWELGQDAPGDASLLDVIVNEARE